MEVFLWFQSDPVKRRSRNVCKSGQDSAFISLLYMEMQKIRTS